MSYVPTEAKTAIVGAKVSEAEKAAWEETVRRLGMESLSDLIRAAVRRYLDRPAPSALELAEKVVRDVEVRYAPLIERVTAEIEDAKNKLSGLEQEEARLAAEIEVLAGPPSLEETPAEIAEKVAKLGEKKTLREAVSLKIGQLKEYVQSLEEKRRKLEARRERQKALTLRAVLPEVFGNILTHLTEEIVAAGKALAPFVRVLASRERPEVILRWIWFYLGWQARKANPEAWGILGRPYPLTTSNFETLSSFMTFLATYCGPFGPAEGAEADLDAVDVAE